MSVHKRTQYAHGSPAINTVEALIFPYHWPLQTSRWLLGSTSRLSWRAPSLAWSVRGRSDDLLCHDARPLRGGRVLPFREIQRLVDGKLEALHFLSEDEVMKRGRGLV